MGEGVCPHCGGELKFEDKNTFTGRDMREYRCVSCGKSVIEDRGVALWQVLHDDREEQERRRTAAAAKKPWWKFWKK
jgi:DNA-directed RNA polymerase subunit RPC12/RpoP